MRMRPAWCWRKRGVRRQQGEGELSAALRLLPELPLAGRLLTGDALYCQQEVCRQVLAAGGDYLVTVKDNQPTLHAAIALLFVQPPPGEPFATTAQVGQHGDRLELRQLTASTALNAYLTWPGAKQVFQIVRTVRHQGKLTTQVRYGVTSLGPDRASAAALLRHRRGHWAIENRLHWVRDVTFGEDACQVRSGAAPQVLAALRNSVIGVLRQWRTPNIAAGLRTLAWQPQAPLLLLGIRLP
jgi:predicted transposase YbfD/YdcC